MSTKFMWIELCYDGVNRPLFIEDKHKLSDEGASDVPQP